ncbi:MAG: VOC family protein [Paracoccaceae bacterium]
MTTNRSPKISGIFETHLTVRNLDRSIAFYRDTLGLTLARHYAERNVASLWAGPKGRWYAWALENGDRTASHGLAFCLSRRF